MFEQDDAAGAIAAYRAAFAIGENLVRQEPGNVGWQTDLAAYCHSLGRALSSGTSAERAEARTLFERALRILRPLAAASRLTHDQFHTWLPVFEASLNDLPP